jgi:hypothetical protein
MFGMGLLVARIEHDATPRMTTAMVDRPGPARQVQRAATQLQGTQR